MVKLKSLHLSTEPSAWDPAASISHNMSYDSSTVHGEVGASQLRHPSASVPGGRDLAAASVRGPSQR